MSTVIGHARCGIITTPDITGCLHPFESVLTRNKETLLAGWITPFLIALSPDLRELMTESVHQDLPLFFAHGLNTINNELEEKVIPADVTMTNVSYEIVNKDSGTR